jgi:cytochrome c-type biogenesis protein CcmH
MNWFVIVSGLVLVVILVFLLRPLVMGNRQGNDEEVRIGKVATSNDSRRPRLALVLGVSLPVLAIVLYLGLNGLDRLGAGKNKEVAAAAEPGAHALTPQQILSMVEKLSEKLQANPNDGEGWLMMARSYAVLGRFPESAAAYGRATALLPPNAQMLADFADTVAMTQGKKWQGGAEELVRKALEVDPNNVTALALSGTVYFDRQDYSSAIAEWQKVLGLVSPDSPIAIGIQGSLRDAESRLAAAGGTPKPVVTGGAGKVMGIVVLDQSLAGKFSPSDTVFIFARAQNGPKMPLAMLRKTVADLPLRITLDDSMAMAPNLRLSQYPLVVVGARISKSGDALARAGDWQGLSEPLEPGGKEVKITINSMVN